MTGAAIVIARPKRQEAYLCRWPKQFVSVAFLHFISVITSALRSD